MSCLGIDSEYNPVLHLLLGNSFLAEGYRISPLPNGTCMYYYKKNLNRAESLYTCCYISYTYCVFLSLILHTKYQENSCIYKCNNNRLFVSCLAGHLHGFLLDTGPIQPVSYSTRINGETRTEEAAVFQETDLWHRYHTLARVITHKNIITPNKGRYMWLRWLLMLTWTQSKSAVNCTQGSFGLP